MIYDCFIFNNEFELLELRLRELGGVVDRFVAIEANTTLWGDSKPFLLTAKRERFAGMVGGKLSVHRVTDMPVGDGTDPHLRERHQRECLRAALPVGVVQDGDLIIWSDADEIICAERIQVFDASRGIATLQQPFHIGYLNWRNHKYMYRSKIMTGAYYKQCGGDGHHLRWFNDPRGLDPYLIPEAGWHLTYQGGIERVKRKIYEGAHRCGNETFHAMLDRYEREGIEKCETFAAKVPLVYPYMPRTVVENPGRWRDWLL